MTSSRPVDVRHSDVLGHAAREEPWADQGVSTYVRAREALAHGATEAAVRLAELTVQEAQEAYDLYSLWLQQLPELLLGLGVPGDAAAPSSERARWSAVELRSGWASYRRHLNAFADRARSDDRPGAERELERGRATWQSAHDSATDMLCTLIALGVEHLGEKSVGLLWDRMLAHYYAALPEKYDPATRPWSRSLERLVLDIFEATRGHLCGPARDGTFEVRDEPDRWVVRFAPCGSGGRTYAYADLPGRSFTEAEHDWAWNTIGVCHYCVHCCQLQQRAPIARLGMPLRVIEPPVVASVGQRGRDHCTWYLYKDPTLLPDEAFTAVGAAVPAWLIRARER